MKKNSAKQVSTSGTSESLADLLASARESLAYHVEGAILEFTEEVATRQLDAKLSNSQLARKLGTSPAYVTKLLGGENNFTIETMVKVARSLDCRLRVCLEPEGMETEWLHFLKVKPQTTRISAPSLNWEGTTFQRVARSEQFTESVTLKHEKLAATA